MDVLLAFVALTIFTLMLTIGVNQSFAQLTSLWHQPAVLARALLAVLVLVPAVVIALLFAFDLSPAVATALALLAAAPGAPLTAKRSELAAADVDYTTSLQLTLALLAALVTPLILSVFYALFELSTERVSPLEVAEQIVRVTFLPVIIGLTLQHFAPRLVATIQKPLNILANGLFLLLVIVIVAVLAITPELRSGLLLGWTAIAVIVVTGAAALAIGHILGGPGPERRAGLAVASLARNIGLALFIGGLSEGGSGVLPILLAYMLLGTAVAIPYSIWIKRRIG
jgi:BASS family bile acid:Na+ symporter